MTAQINLTQKQLETIADALVYKEFANSETLKQIEYGELRKDPEFTMWVKGTIEETKKLRESIGSEITKLLLKKNYNK